MPVHPGDEIETHITQWSSTAEQVCRCGTRIAPGTRVIGVVDSSPTISGMLDGLAFCSLRCIRAWFLETLNELDALATPENERIVFDLRSAFVELALAFVVAVDSRSDSGLSRG